MKLARVFRLDFASMLTVATLFTVTWTGVKPGGLLIADLASVTTFAWILYLHMSGRRRLFLPIWVTLPSLAAFALLAIQVFTESTTLVTKFEDQGYVEGTSSFASTGGGAIFVARIFIATGLIYLIVSSEIRRRGMRGARRMILSFAFGGTVSAIVALLSSRGVNIDVPGEYAVVGDRETGLAFHPNSFAQALVLLLPALFFVVFTFGYGKLTKLSAVVGIGVVTYGLYLADSRGGIIVGMFVVTVLSAMLVGRVWGKWWLVPLGTLAAIIAYNTIPLLIRSTRLEELLPGVQSDSSEGRAEKLANSWDQFAANPFTGAGLSEGTAVMVPMALAASGGIVLFLAFYLYVYSALVRTVRLRNPNLRVCMTTNIFALVALGLFNNSVNERFDYVLLSLSAALAITTLAKGKVGQTDPLTRSKYRVERR